MTKAFYREWRPATWQEVIGQDHVVQTLKNSISSQHVGHAYLFSGPRGIGKTTVARLLAKAINCTNEDPAQRPDNTCQFCSIINEGKYMDLIEIDAASNTSVEDVRDLREKINYKPSLGQYKVYIIDEVHMLSTAAFNALLKTLEEPPPHAIFILATTEAHKIPATVISRCQRFEFRRIPVSQIVDYLKEKTASEKIQIGEEALTLIARQATGSMRDAVSLLDQLASTGDEITLEMTEAVLGTATSQKVVELFDALIAHQTADGLQIIQQALDAGTDPRQFARQVVDYLHNLLLIKSGNGSQVDAAKEMKASMETQAARLDNPKILKLLRSFNHAANEMRNNWQPGLLLEMALVENTQPDIPQEPAADESRIPAPAVKPSAQTAPMVPAPADESKVPAPAVKPSTQTALKKPAPADENPQKAVPSEPVAKSVEKPAIPASGVSGDLNAILERWEDVCKEIKKHKNSTYGMINSSRPLIKNNALVLAFQSDLLRERMEADENISLLKQVVKEMFGAEVMITCAVSSSKAKASASDLGVDSDGLVGTALNQGGKIVHRD